MMTGKKGIAPFFFVVKVFPRSKKQEVQKLAEREFKVYVTSPPARGEANREVIELLASYFGVPRSYLKILRGEKSRLKVIQLLKQGVKQSRRGRFFLSPGKRKRNVLSIFSLEE